MSGMLPNRISAMDAVKMSIILKCLALDREMDTLTTCIRITMMGVSM